MAAENFRENFGLSLKLATRKRKIFFPDSLCHEQKNLFEQGLTKQSRKNNLTYLATILRTYGIVPLAMKIIPRD